MKPNIIPNTTHRIYTTVSIAALPKTTNRSLIYWRAQARQILARHPLAVVIIHDSRTDAINAGELRREDIHGINLATC